MSVGSDQYTVQCQFSRGRWASFATAIGIFVLKVAALPKMCNVYQSAKHNNFDPQIFSRVGQRPWKAKECDTSCYLQRCWPCSVTLACRHTSCFYNYQDELAVMHERSCRWIRWKGPRDRAHVCPHSRDSDRDNRDKRKNKVHTNLISPPVLLTPPLSISRLSFPFPAPCVVFLRFFLTQTAFPFLCVEVHDVFTRQKVDKGGDRSAGRWATQSTRV